MPHYFKAAFRLLCAAAITVGQVTPAIVVMPQSAFADQGMSLLRINSPQELPSVRQVKLGLNKSIIVELPIPVRDVMVSDPDKVDAVMQTSQRAYIVGKDVGEANVFFTDDKGNQVLTLELSIQRDLSALQNLMNRLIPGAAIRVEQFDQNVILTGTVKTPIDAAQASEIAQSVLSNGNNTNQSSSSGGAAITINSSTSSGGNQGGGLNSSSSSQSSNGKIINMISVEGREQVLLKVSVVEMERNLVKQLGVDLNSVVTSGNFTFAALSRLPFPVSGGTTVGTASAGLGWASGANSVQSAIQALEQDNLVHTLAEPNLTAISGETANFLAGGEFPIPVAGNNGQITVQFKKFGVGLAFTPVVMSEGRISLKISTEVSELSNDGAVSVPIDAQTGATVTIPALKVRRAETTVELPSGGSLAIAGLLSDQSRQALSGYPGLKNLPVLGALFRSRDFQKDESELVVLVTPYIAKAVARGKLTQPDQGFGWASDANSDLLGQMNRVYGREPEHRPVGKFQGNVGYIVE